MMTLVIKLEVGIRVTVVQHLGDFMHDFYIIVGAVYLTCHCHNIFEIAPVTGLEGPCWL